MALQRTLQRKQQASELLRYALCTGIVSIGMAFNKKSPAALMNMHSARLVLTLQEAREKWAYSGMDVFQAMTSASSLLASCSVLALGFSKTSCFLESAHFAINTIRLGEQWFHIRQAMQKVSRSSSSFKQLAKMHAKSVFNLFCAFIEFASFSLRLWPVYLVTNAVRGGYILYKSVLDDPEFSMRHAYEAFIRPIILC